MTILEALQNALTFIEAAGITGGDVHEDLRLAICTLQNDYYGAAMVILPEVDRG